MKGRDSERMSTRIWAVDLMGSDEVGGVVVRGLGRDLRGGIEGLGFWRGRRKWGVGFFRVLEKERLGREDVGGLAVNISLSLCSDLEGWMLGTLSPCRYLEGWIREKDMLGHL